MDDKPMTTSRPRTEGETRGLAQDVGTQFLGSAAEGGGFTAGALVVAGAAAKVKDALTPKQSKVVLPPGTEK